MHIFVDESGTFALPSANGPSISCVGALAIADGKLDAILKDLDLASEDWPKHQGIIKGRLLGEKEIRTALEILANAGAIFECAAIDLGLHTHDGIRGHQISTAQNIRNNIIESMDKRLALTIETLASDLSSLPIQQYVQMSMMTTVLFNFHRSKILYYVLTAPRELSNFFWVIDQKDKSITKYEQLWSTLVAPFVEARSLKNPVISLIGADYSHFARFMSTRDGPPKHLREYAEHHVHGEPFHTIDVKLWLTEHRKFSESRSSPGLQLVDIALSAASRALRGNLQHFGWSLLSRILVKNHPPLEVIDFVGLESHSAYWSPHPPYHYVLSWLRKHALDLPLP